MRGPRFVTPAGAVPRAVRGRVARPTSVSASWPSAHEVGAAILEIAVADALGLDNAVDQARRCERPAVRAECDALDLGRVLGERFAAAPSARDVPHDHCAVPPEYLQPFTVATVLYLRCG